MKLKVSHGNFKRFICKVLWSKSFRRCVWAVSVHYWIFWKLYVGSFANWRDVRIRSNQKFSAPFSGLKFYQTKIIAPARVWPQWALTLIVSCASATVANSINFILSQHRSAKLVMSEIWNTLEITHFNFIYWRSHSNTYKPTYTGGKCVDIARNSRQCLFSLH